MTQAAQMRGLEPRLASTLTMCHQLSVRTVDLEKNLVFVRYVRKGFLGSEVSPTLLSTLDQRTDIEMVGGSKLDDWYANTCQTWDQCQNRFDSLL